MIPGLLDEIFVEKIDSFVDHRGALYKLFPWPVLGEVYALGFQPGASRGHHLHRQAEECFACLSGPVELLLGDPETGRTRVLLLQGGRVRVPAGIAHALRATDRTPADCLVLAAMDRPHDPEDVFASPLIVPERRSERLP